MSDSRQIDLTEAIDRATRKAIAKATFEGPDLTSVDHERLGAQLSRIYNLMKDGRWRSLAQISKLTGDPEASVSAQCRHLRKPRFGGHIVERQHLGGGVYEYRLIVNRGEK